MAGRDAFDVATRIAAGDDKANYDNVAITLHWLTALLVVTQFALAETWDWFPRDTRENLQGVHVSFGVMLTAVVLVRLIWRWMPGHQRSPLAVGWMLIASKAVHYLLYALLVVQAVLGFTWRWAQGHGVGFFGLFAIPGPYGQLARPTRHLLAEFHEKIGWAIVIIAFGHALAALYHHYALRDRVLGRMLPLARRSERRF
ncbi:MAG TPA: cytochrome b [Sphingomicrobium sp.]|jgi:cytochrome b561